MRTSFLAIAALCVALTACGYEKKDYNEAGYNNATTYNEGASYNESENYATGGNYGEGANYSKNAANTAGNYANTVNAVTNNGY